VFPAAGGVLAETGENPVVPGLVAFGKLIVE